MLLLATVPSEIESIAIKGETIQETSEESLLMKKIAITGHLIAHVKKGLETIQTWKLILDGDLVFR